VVLSFGRKLLEVFQKDLMSLLMVVGGGDDEIKAWFYCERCVWSNERTGEAWLWLKCLFSVLSAFIFPG
jgi:hypothetical protein